MTETSSGQATPAHVELDPALSARVAAAGGRWLVTGAAGFIGSNLVETLLRLGQRVRAFDNYATGKRANLDEALAASGADPALLEIVEGDIRDRAACAAACEGVTHVLHQAALGSVPRSIDDPVTSNDVNVGGFVAMLDAARRAGARFVYAASSSTYGDEPNLPKVEERIGKPLSPYAVTKAVNEIYADVFARTYGYPSVGLRYFNVFGPRQDPDGAYAAVIPKWVGAMIAGGSIIINGDGETSRDFTYVGNVVQANLLAALDDGGEGARVYNVAAEARTSLNQLFAALRDGLAAEGVAYTTDAVYGPERKGDVRHSLASVAKARAELGYAPREGLSEGLALTMPWYVANLSR